MTMREELERQQPGLTDHEYKERAKTRCGRLPPYPGDFYGHYKGGVYLVLGKSVDEATLDTLVHYHSLTYGGVMTRTLAVWEEIVLCSRLHDIDPRTHAVQDVEPRAMPRFFPIGDLETFIFHRESPVIWAQGRTGYNLWQHVPIEKTPQAAIVYHKVRDSLSVAVRAFNAPMDSWDVDNGVAALREVLRLVEGERECRDE